MDEEYEELLEAKMELKEDLKALAPQRLEEPMQKVKKALRKVNQYASKVRNSKDQKEWDGSYGRYKRAHYDAKELFWPNRTKVWRRINDGNKRHLKIIAKILRLEMCSVGPLMYFRST